MAEDYPLDQLSSSLQDYLEAILCIVEQKGGVRVKDIADRLDVSSPSVTGALQALAERGLVNYSPYDVITLTKTGKRTAQRIVDRHEALRDFFLTVLKADEKTAREAACRMEHALDDELMERFVSFTRFMASCPYCGPTWEGEKGYICQRADARGSESGCQR